MMDIMSGGERDKRDRNDLEAQAIAAEVAALIADTRFAGRTIAWCHCSVANRPTTSTLSFGGSATPANSIRRRFECGDARNFQGSDRAIIFRSMVCPQTAISAVEQRFNVAAAAARPMYLVRSVTTSSVRSGTSVPDCWPTRQAACSGHAKSESLLERCDPNSNVRSTVSSCHALSRDPAGETGATALMLVAKEAATRLRLNATVTSSPPTGTTAGTTTHAGSGPRARQAWTFCGWLRLHLTLR